MEDADFTELSLEDFQLDFSIQWDHWKDGHHLHLGPLVLIKQRKYSKSQKISWMMR
jgi:hypothetical protein